MDWFSTNEEKKIEQNAFMQKLLIKSILNERTNELWYTLMTDVKSFVITSIGNEV